MTVPCHYGIIFDPDFCTRYGLVLVFHKDNSHIIVIQMREYSIFYNDKTSLIEVLPNFNVKIIRNYTVDILTLIIML